LVSLTAVQNGADGRRREEKSLKTRGRQECWSPTPTLFLGDGNVLGFLRRFAIENIVTANLSEGGGNGRKERTKKALLHLL